jgi:hypothetical protein
VDAGAVGLLGWTDTILSCDVECVLYKGVLEGVERDDPKTPTGPEDADCCLQASFEAFELVVHRDAKRLERARRTTCSTSSRSCVVVVIGVRSRVLTMRVAIARANRSSP